MKRNFLILIVITAVFIGGILLIRSENIGTNLLWRLSDQGRQLFPLVTAGALIDSLHICALSIMIMTIAFLLSLGRARSEIFKIGGFYIFGIFLAYVLIGLGIFHAFHFFNTPDFMGKLGAAILIILGLINLQQALFPKSPIKLKIPKASHRIIAGLMEKASSPAAFVLGVLVGICAFPCAGGPYLTVIGLLHDKVTYLKGMIYLIYYNILFVLPLILILLISGNKAVLDKVDVWQKQNNRTLRWVSGLLMIALGLIIFLV
jgi:cytochrome c biogenesis protein CcdA